VNKRFEDIARRKQALIEKAALQRTELAAAYHSMRSPFELGRILFGVGRALKAYPVIAAAISSILVSGYAGKLLRGAGEIVKLWRLFLPIHTWWSKRRRITS
jgi:hypothetical protein